MLGFEAPEGKGKGSGETEGELGTGGCKQLGREIAPVHGAEDWVVRTARELDGYGFSAHTHLGPAADEVAVELSSVAVFEPPEPARQHGVEGPVHC